MTATSRIETILKNARIPFTYIDTATNESAKKLFQRRARGKKLPLLVKEGFVIADFDEVEEYNEFGELEEVIGDVTTDETSIISAPKKMGLAREGDTHARPATVIANASAPSTPVKEAETKKENQSQQSSVMGQLAQEAATKAKQIAKKVPTPLLPKTNDASTPAKTKSESKEKATPLSPSGVSLPASPTIKSPTTTTSIDSAVKSPTSESATPSSPDKSHASSKPPPPSHHRHNSTGSTHSFIPEKSEPEAREHRGSEVSIASREEIKRIENECSIAEEDEDEELDKAAEDAILFGDAEEDEDEPVVTKTEEKEVTRKSEGSSSASSTLAPSSESKTSDPEAAMPKPAPLNIKGGVAKIQGVMKSAGLTPQEPDKAVESGEVDDSDETEEEEDEDEEEEEEEDDAANESSKAKPTPAATATGPTKASTGTTASKDSTTTADSKLAKAGEKVKIGDQEPAETKQAGDSVED